MKALAFAALVALAALAFVTAAPSASAKSNQCIEQSDVVGDRLCGRYGSLWSVERSVPLTVAMGLWSSHVEPRGRQWYASSDKGGEGVGVSGAAMGMRSIQTVGFDFRFVGNLSPHVYLGMDTAMAFAAVDSAVAPTGGFTFRDKRTLDFVHVRHGLVLGARIPMGRLSFRVETLVGFDVVSASLDLRKNDGTWMRGSVASLGLLVEPRVAADLWTSPWATTSVWAGTNFLHPNDRSMGVMFAFHGRPFDGRFSL